MGILDHWIKADALNVYQIALLLERIDPAPLERLGYSGLPVEIIDQTTVHVVNLKNAILTANLTPKLPSYGDFGELNWEYTLISIRTLQEWLWIRDFDNTIFGPYPRPRRDYSQKFDKHYAPKLAAAMDAWTAVTTDPKRLRGKSPKQALETWLTENAGAYGLLNKDGTPNKTGIEEVAKVANWNQNGGAPRTPTASLEATPSFGRTGGEVVESPPMGFGKWEEDEEIPF